MAMLFPFHYSASFLTCYFVGTKAEDGRLNLKSWSCVRRHRKCVSHLPLPNSSRVLGSSIKPSSAFCNTAQGAVGLS